MAGNDSSTGKGEMHTIYDSVAELIGECEVASVYVYSAWSTIERCTL